MRVDKKLLHATTMRVQISAGDPILAEAYFASIRSHDLLELAFLKLSTVTAAASESTANRTGYWMV